MVYVFTQYQWQKYNIKWNKQVPENLIQNDFYAEKQTPHNTLLEEVHKIW